ncbi:MAG: DUF2769 domain-containing protein [Methanoregula sp.]|uniref:DUF2769 domain-containing protein n=1 Tax=Methanoregula sp. TaxID=2052170 RepID=UPI003D0EF471
MILSQPLGRFRWPAELFCARGTTSVPSPKELNCYCPACELWKKHSLVIGHFCVKD